MCRMCGALGEEDYVDELRAYLISRRSLVFSGAVESAPCCVTHECRDPDSDTGGRIRTAYRQSRDGAYTERWCRHCMYYLRLLIPDGPLTHG